MLKVTRANISDNRKDNEALRGVCSSRKQKETCKLNLVLKSKGL